MTGCSKNFRACEDDGSLLDRTIEAMVTRVMEIMEEPAPGEHPGLEGGRFCEGGRCMRCDLGRLERYADMARASAHGRIRRSLRRRANELARVHGVAAPFVWRSRRSEPAARRLSRPRPRAVA